MIGTQGSVYTPNPKRHRCEICGMVFETSVMLSYHKSVEHKLDKKSPTGVS
ncbi:MAG: hypothetical protein ABR515_07520 [Nitrososphaeraceae archaeon]